MNKKQPCRKKFFFTDTATAELYTNLKIEVKGGLSGAPRAKDRLDLWMNFSQIAQLLGLPVNGIEVFRELLDSMGLRVDFTRFIMSPGPVAAPGTVVGPGNPGMVLPGGAPGGGAPQPSRGAGPDGGAPTMG